MSLKRIKERTAQRKTLGLIPLYSKKQKVTVVVPPKIPPCPFRGLPTGNTTGCQSCQGKVSLKVFECRIYGECTIAKRVEDVKGCCKDCPDNPLAPPQPPGIE